jgi:L-aminopeptidase/D-esterase-like protein
MNEEVVQEEEIQVESVEEAASQAEPNLDSQSGEVEADVVEINQGGVETVKAETVNVEQGGIARAEAQTVKVVEGGIGLAMGETIMVSDGGVGLAVAQKAELEDATVAFLAAGEISGEDVTVVFDVRAAVIFGFVVGLVLSLFKLISGGHGED